MNYSNKANLYIITGPCDGESVDRCFKDMIDQIKRLYILDSDVKKGTYQINTVYSSSGKLVGVTYAWVSHPKLYNLLIGQNPDGSDRVDYIEDPEWIAPESGSWGDMSPDMIKKELPPLVKPKPIKDEEGNDYIIKIFPAYVTLPGPEYDASTICCRSSPGWITTDMIHGIFDKFNTDKYEHDVIIDKKQVRIKYPDVRIRHVEKRSEDTNEERRRIIYITYSRLEKHVTDALFALQLCRKVNLRKGDRECQLSFSLWKNAVKNSDP